MPAIKLFTVSILGVFLLTGLAVIVFFIGTWIAYALGLMLNI